MKLSELEVSVLALVYDHGDELNGTVMAEHIKRYIGRDVTMDAIHATLNRLEEKDLLHSWWSEPPKYHGSRRQRMFEIMMSESRDSAIDSRKRMCEITRTGVSTLKTEWHRRGLGSFPGRR